MKPGDAVYIPANALHSAMTLGTSPAHFILIYSHGDYEAHRARGGFGSRMAILFGWMVVSC
jgi:quercetin dioxygenase-like cupin family protein